MANKLFIYNMNPDNKSIGDCVLRAITNFSVAIDHDKIEGTDKDLERELYNQHKMNILSIKNRYDIVTAFGPYLDSIGFVRIRVSENVQIKTFNQLAKFCDRFNTPALGVANNHMVFIDNKGVAIDTWNSILKRLKYFYIKKSDADRLGIKYGINESTYFLCEKDLNTISKKCKISPDKISFEE